MRSPDDQPPVSAARAGNKATYLAVAAGIALSAPALALDFHDDDFFHRLSLSGRVAEFRRDIWSLYEFLPASEETRRFIESGLVPWFTDPEMRTRFFRPLASASLAFDVLVFGDWAFPAYLQSLVWFSLLLLLVARIHRALLPERAAFRSTLVYALAGSHAAATSWVAARHALMSAVFGLAAFAVSLSRRDSRVQSSLSCGLGSAALVGIGLLSSEATLAAAALLMVELALGFRGTRRERWLRGVPVALMSLAYLGFYALAGYGTRRMGSYVSPFESPARFALAAVERMPLLLAETFSGVPSPLAQVSPLAFWLLWVLGVASAAGVASIFYRATRTERSLRWLPLGVLAALVPFAGTIIDGRVLFVPMVASSMLVGIVIAARGTLVPRWAASTLFVAALVLSPLARVGITLANGRAARIETELVTRSKLDCPAGARLTVVNGADPAIGMYSGPLFALAGAEWSGLDVLSFSPNDLTLERTGPRSFVLQTLGPRRRTEFEAVYRAAPPPEGTLVRTRGLTAEVVESSKLGATVVRFELATELDRSCLVRWTGGIEGHLESFVLPETGVLTLPHEPGPHGI